VWVPTRSACGGRSDVLLRSGCAMLSLQSSQRVGHRSGIRQANAVHMPSQVRRTVIRKRNDSEHLQNTGVERISLYSEVLIAAVVSARSWGKVKEAHMVDLDVNYKPNSWHIVNFSDGES
jgi:hypothetical protein